MSRTTTEQRNEAHMANTEDNKGLASNEEWNTFVEFAILAWVLFCLAMTDVDNSSEESFLDELLRTACMMLSVGIVILFLLSELYARTGGASVLVATLIGLTYLLRNRIIDKLCDILYNLISRPFGIYD